MNPRWMLTSTREKCSLPLVFTHRVFGPEARTTDLQKRLDRATYYCFTTQVFEAIGAVLVGRNLLVIGGI